MMKIQPPPPPSLIMLIMMTTDPKAKESLMMAVVEVMLIILTAVVMMRLLHLSLFLFEILKIFGRFAADLRILTPYRVECFGKRLIFGLDTTTNR